MISDTCGKNLIWTLDNGTLTISGSGEMNDISWLKERPAWFDRRKSIKKIVIADGVIKIGSYAFSDCRSLEKICYPVGSGFEKILSEDNDAKLISHQKIS